MVEFSQPKPAKPIPIATVRVYFTVKVDQDENRNITFRFEKDSLIHSIDQTIRKKRYAWGMFMKDQSSRSKL